MILRSSGAGVNLGVTACYKYVAPPGLAELPQPRYTIPVILHPTCAGRGGGRTSFRAENHGPPVADDHQYRSRFFLRFKVGVLEWWSIEAKS